MPRTGTRRTIDRGIYQDARGFEVVARAGRRRKSKRFPLDTVPATLRAWRDGQAGELHEEPQPTTDTRTIAGAVQQYLKLRKAKGRDPYKDPLAAWVRVYGPLERRKLTPAKAAQAFEQWKAEGYAAQTLYYRRLVLKKLWQACDGPKVKTPVDDIRIKRTRAARAPWVQEAVINQVAVELWKHEQKGVGLLRDSKTRARFLVLVSTGQRPAQLRRTTRADVDLERGIWWVHAAKGGEPIPLYLNEEMKIAWGLFVKAQAWGDYDRRNFARVLRRCGWPKGVRPYAARHALGLTLRQRGADMTDIQDYLGHTDPSTTRVYAGRLEDRMQAVSESLDGRFGWGRVAPKRGTPQNR